MEGTRDNSQSRRTHTNAYGTYKHTNNHIPLAEKRPASASAPCVGFLGFIFCDPVGTSRA